MLEDLSILPLSFCSNPTEKFVELIFNTFFLQIYMYKCFITESHDSKLQDINKIKKRSLSQNDETA